MYLRGCAHPQASGNEHDWICGLFDDDPKGRNVRNLHSNESRVVQVSPAGIAKGRENSCRAVEAVFCGTAARDRCKEAPMVQHIV